MTELEKYALVLGCETFSDFKTAIEKIGPVLGSNTTQSVEKMHHYIDIIKGSTIDFYDFYSSSNRQYGFSIFNKLTRTYGIRNKAIYLKLYRDQE